MTRAAMLAVALMACGGGEDAAVVDATGPTVDAAVGAEADAAIADWNPVEVHVPDGPLCDIPPNYVANGGDPTYIDCAVAHDRFSDGTGATDRPRVVAWNIEFGNDFSTVLGELMTNPALVDADVLLLSEVARASLTSNPDGVDVARELAMALAMDYAFAVEWDRREKPEELGEHGVAILSKYPLGNVTQIRHVPLND